MCILTVVVVPPFLRLLAHRQEDESEEAPANKEGEHHAKGA